MPNHKLLSALKDAFSFHGKPVPKEDPEWAIVLLTLVLLIQTMEKMMSTLQDLSDNAKAEASALVDLNNTVATMAPPAAAAGVAPGSTSLSEADQTLLDSANDTIKSNIAKIAEIKTALGMPTKPADGAPANGPATVTPPPPVVSPITPPPAS